MQIAGTMQMYTPVKRTFLSSTPAREEHDSGYFDNSPVAVNEEGMEDPFAFVRRDVSRFLENPTLPRKGMPCSQLLEIKNRLHKRLNIVSRYSLIIQNIHNSRVNAILILLNGYGKQHGVKFSLEEAQNLYNIMRSHPAVLFQEPRNEAQRFLDFQKSSSENSPYSEFPSTPIKQLAPQWETDVDVRSRNKSFTAQSEVLRRSDHNPVRLHLLPRESPNIELNCNAHVQSISSPIFFSPLSPKIDILKGLSEIDCSSTISNVLSFLTVEDIQAVSSVNSLWRYIVLKDKKANNRRKVYLRQKRNSVIGGDKENKHKAKAKETREDRVLFSNLVNDATIFPKQPLESRGSKTRYDAFLEVAKTLKKSDILLKCPMCQYPSKSLDGVKYCCTRTLCAYEFCKQCNGPYLGDHSCYLKDLETNQPRPRIGSKNCKRNLRRL